MRQDVLYLMEKNVGVQIIFNVLILNVEIISLTMGSNVMEELIVDKIVNSYAEMEG